VTTNYDRLLERAFDEQNIRYTSVIRDTDLPYRNSRLLLIKLHGCISDLHSIKITEDDYRSESFREQQRFVVNKVRGQFVDRVILFLGYGLEDSTFRDLYHNVLGHLGSHKIRSYAVQLSPTELEIDYWDRHDVKILDCDALIFLEEIEEKLASDVEGMRKSLCNAVEAFRADGTLMEKDTLEEIKGKIDILSDQLMLTSDMEELLMRSAMHYYSEPASWPTLVPDDRDLRINVAWDLLTSDRAQAQENAVLEIGYLIENGDLSSKVVLDKVSKLSQDEKERLVSSDAFFKLPRRIAVSAFRLIFSESGAEMKKEVLVRLKSLARRQAPNPPESLIKCAATVLESDDSELFGLSLQVLKSIHTDPTANYDAVADCLEEFARGDISADRQRTAVLMLKDRRTKRAVKLLTRLVYAEEEGLRKVALSALREFLQRKAWAENDRETRRAAVDELMKVRGTSLEAWKSILTELARDSDEWIQKQVLQALDEFFDLEEQPAILRSVLLQTRYDTEHDEVRRIATDMLIATRDRSPETEALLQDLTRDDDSRIRKRALHSLDDFFEQGELPKILTPNLSHDKKEVREDTLEFLKGFCSDDEIFEYLPQGSGEN
jgi:HEAT repeat protein